MHESAGAMLGSGETDMIRKRAGRMSRIVTVVLALSLVAGLCSAAMAQPLGGRASFEAGRFDDARRGAAQLDLQIRVTFNGRCSRIFY